MKGVCARSYNSYFRNIASLYAFSGKEIFSAHSAACIFNKGFYPILRVIKMIGVKIGSNAKTCAEKVDSARIDKAEKDTWESSKAHWIAVKNAKPLQNDKRYIIYIFSYINIACHCVLFNFTFLFFLFFFSSFNLTFSRHYSFWSWRYSLPVRTQVDVSIIHYSQPVK